jgi:hypothetical protein
MKTASLGRRLGDWLGIVPEDDIPWSTAADLPDLEGLPRESVRVEPRVQRRPKAPPAPPVRKIPPAPAVAQPTPDPPAPSPVRLGSPIPEPAKNVLTFRQVVNQRRAESQRRAVHPQAPPRW